jgi:hypothetical protein
MIFPDLSGSKTTDNEKGQHDTVLGGVWIENVSLRRCMLGKRVWAEAKESERKDRLHKARGRDVKYSSYNFYGLVCASQLVYKVSSLLHLSSFS